MRTLDTGMSLTDVLEEWHYTFARLDAYEYTKALTAELLPLEELWNQVHLRELLLLRQRALARALVTAADNDLDRYIDAFNNLLKTLVGNDTTSDLYQRFFYPKRPSELKRPILGAQLTTMSTWQKTLATMEQPTLRAQADVLVPLVQKGKDAEEALRQAQQDLDDFYALHEFKTFIDRFNAGRSVVYGKLNELRHSRPDLNLATDFAEQFFVREERSRGVTLASQRKTVERLEQQLERQRAVLSRLEAEAQAEADAEAEAERVALEKELKELENQRRLADEREAAIRSRLKR